MEERETTATSGWLMLPVMSCLILGVPLLIGAAVEFKSAWLLLAIVALGLFDLLMLAGFFILQPGEARVLVLFGKYVGSVKTSGFFWANPFSVQHGVMSSMDLSISVRARNFETSALKVNDQRGNPIEIGAVVVWRVQDTAKALFDIESYQQYVKIQSETAVRHLAQSYPYDHMDNAAQTQVTLRGNSDEISHALEGELRERLSRAGVLVEEARLTHLAYSPEIAGVMLRRQQAEAIVAARQKIVQGAVSMVEMALTELSTRKVIELDEERKAAMVGNLLVVLCGMTEAEPVINAGTLYH